MNKLNCEVIKDLMPSYLDDICSEASKELVELHISQCTSCKELLKEMRETEFVTQKSDIEQINHMHKIKLVFAKRNIIILGLLCAFVLIGMIMIMRQYGSVPMNIYYVILPMIMVAIYLIQSDYLVIRKMANDIKCFLCVAVVGLLYAICLQGWSVYMCNSGDFPAWIPLQRLGPVWYIQYLFIAIVELVICISSLLLGAKKEQSYGAIPYISTTGAVLCLVFISIMKHMSNVENYLQMVFVPFGMIVIEGVLFGTIFLLLQRRK